MELGGRRERREFSLRSPARENLYIIFLAPWRVCVQQLNNIDTERARIRSAGRAGNFPINESAGGASAVLSLYIYAVCAILQRTVFVFPFARVHCLPGGIPSGCSQPISAEQKRIPRGFFHVWGHAAELKIAAVAAAIDCETSAGRQNKWPTCKSMRRELWRCALFLRTYTHMKIDEVRLHFTPVMLFRQ